MDEILGAVSMLAQDQYGNYVVQVIFYSDCVQGKWKYVFTIFILLYNLLEYLENTDDTMVVVFSLLLV